MPGQPTWQKLLLGDKSKPRAKYVLLSGAAILVVAALATIAAAVAQGSWQWIIGVAGLAVAAASAAWAFHWWD